VFALAKLDEGLQQTLWNSMSLIGKGVRFNSCVIKDAAPKTLDNGLRTGNNYAIINCYEREDIKLLQLRHSAGKGHEWNGDWSDKSDLWKMHEDIRNELKVKDEDDGMFWMSWEDFLQTWSHVYVARVLNPKNPISQYYDKSIPGINTLKYKFSLPSSRVFAVGIDQRDLNYTQKLGSYSSIGLSVRKKGEKLDTPTVSKVRYRSIAWWPNSGRLPAGDYILDVHFSPKTSTPFYIRVWTGKNPVELTKVNIRQKKVATKKKKIAELATEENETKEVSKKVTKKQSTKTGKSKTKIPTKKVTKKSMLQ